MLIRYEKSLDGYLFLVIAVKRLNYNTKYLNTYMHYLACGHVVDLYHQKVPGKNWVWCKKCHKRIKNNVS